ncbi:type IV secretion system protein VirB2 [Luteibacter rhizovicinus]|uniref:Type IV secretion system protein VirB2 n=1 Tax=Luteibacter rhizovicinus TaxID=242606 RepID=A0A4R3YVZ0_9GAMM|nr:TrbC/VirB2 family protein [Luteibacter rhizovicinus]TCV97227.1 type IV secretion system protein VirB2 [Luteibacter rhizovicinus]
MALPSLSNTVAQSKSPSLSALVVFAVIASLLIPEIAFAQIEQTGTKVCGFFQNINSLLNAASIVVVTVAVIFSGYQIAFAHKRIADVAPVMIGGVLIGAAAQVANMVVGGNGTGGGAQACTSSSGNTTAMLMDSMHSVLHVLQNYA